MNKLIKSKYKTKAFAKEYIRTGFNGASAIRNIANKAMSVGVASTQAGRLLKKVEVRQEIEQELMKQGITPGLILDSLKTNMTSGAGVKSKATDSNRASELLLKLFGLLGNQTNITRISLEAKYSEMSKDKLINEHRRLTEQFNSIIDGEVLDSDTGTHPISEM